MAQDWIKVEKTTPEKPEVLCISEILEIHPTHAFGLCVRFWLWCDDQMQSMSQKFVTNVTLDYVVGHKGFADALVVVGWLRVREGSLEVPNFDRHLSESAKKRADSGRRKQKQRESVDSCVTEMSQNFVTNVTELSQKCHTPSLSLSLSNSNHGDDFSLEESFESFWKTYPCAQGKKPARAAFEKAIARLSKKMTPHDSAEKLIQAAKDYADYIGKAVNPPAVKYAQGWLNDERYEDDFIEALAKSLDATTKPRKLKTFADQRIENSRAAIEAFANG